MKKLMCLLFLSLFAASTYAQNYSGSVTSLGGGISLVSKSERETGYNLFFNYGRIVNKNFGFRFELAYHSAPFSAETTLTTPFDRTIKTDGNDYGISLKGEIIIGKFNDQARYLYYGIAGIGYDISGTGGDTKIEGHLLYNESGESSWAVGPYYNPVLVLGGGIGYRISGKTAFVLEIKMESIQDYQYYPIRLGLTFLPSISE
jgi:hypothetical protein